MLVSALGVNATNPATAAAADDDGFDYMKKGEDDDEGEDKTKMGATTVQLRPRKRVKTEQL